MMTIEHRPRYEAAVQSYMRARRVEPDREWKALLLLLTTLPSLWDKARPYLEFDRGNAHLADMLRDVDLSGGEMRLLELARNLFNGGEKVDVAALAGTLDAERWAVVLEAIRTFRGGAADTSDRAPYQMGRLYAVCEDIIRAASRQKPEPNPNARRELASKDPDTVTRIFRLATNFTPETDGDRQAWYENTLTELVSGIDQWPERRLTHEEQDDWWIGYHHERKRIQENLPDAG